MAVNEGTAIAVERMLTVRQLAAIWQCCEKTIRRAIDRGELDAIRITPGALRVKESEAARYLAKRETVAA